MERDRKNCSGCSACFSICPVSAIEMKADKLGFLYPDTDEKTCIECGLCAKVCPIHFEVKLSDNTYYGLKRKDPERLKSTSGGAFLLLAENIVKQGGVVFGCAFDEKMDLRYSMAEDINGVRNLPGSKYVQANPGDTFNQVGKNLEEGRKVLYFGNPCMIHGLKLFLTVKYGKIHPNLFLVDHICYGVPSPALWKNYISFLENENDGKVLSFCFRSKEKPDSAHTVKYFVEKDGEMQEHLERFQQNLYVRMFQKNLSLRESCFHCKYCTDSRESDMTLGDFWGIENTYPNFDDGYGVSLVIIHSDKGKAMLEEIENGADIFQTNAAAASQPRLHECAKESILRKFFLKDMERLYDSQENFHMILKKYGS